MTAKPKRIPTQRSQDRAHKRKPCIDCTAEGITTKRKAPHPGPRCVTHHRAVRAKRKSLSQEQRWMQVYGITAEQYWEIYEEQGGLCYICRRANGKRKRLSVDHDHATGIVRGLLCTACNRNVLGHLRDDPEAFERAIDYLDRPPAVRAIGVIVVPDFVAET
ncbi:EndoVII [Mycobacterium phage RhynO]|uniref:Recombination endonuclease VII n=4 Tax=Fromanvirus TaxID=186764 RepID=H9NCP1_9CAUD|nr:endonuclease VII [Mycobacterium phage RhynO]YP_009607528.1 endonuclease VII [Mycobacterium phage Twister]YP_009638887.1 endonuclease VII [Mycobacterium phage Rebeuca]QBP32007.1 endonuclease VII [Mycobacterium phage Kristoff]QGJ94733.1 endonuclease VII [Mycobacterium phage WalterMcMickey]QLF84454.1 endonuclease VII [Mycobacterium phage Topanga]AFF28362.1 recombination endonuclease VII [Mycobacterium phage Twister]AFQ97366.1 EndoVII [Mycobacterium phage Rebeuca]